MERTKKTFLAKAESDESKRTVVARITTQAVDRDGDVVVADGMDASEFMANPVVFFNHNYDLPPIGRATEIKKGDGEIVATTRFADRPEGHQGEWLPDTILSLFAQGVVRGFSIGFDALEGGIRRATKADIAKYGEGVKQVFSKWKLFEYSVAPLPANQEALAMAVRKSILTKDRAGELFPGVQIEAPKRRTVVFIAAPRKAQRKATPPPSPEAMAALAVRKAAGEVFV